MFIDSEEHRGNEQGYYSCPWIEHGLVFFNKKLSMCCHCGHSTNEHITIVENVTNDNFSMDKVFEFKREFRENHKQGKIHENCINCNYLRREKWPDTDYIDNLYISHWIQCNSNCIYCYERQHSEEFKNEAPYKVLPIIKEMHEKDILRPGGDISFGGGEPAVLDEFEDILNYLLDHYYIDNLIHTSGIKYSEAMARGLQEMAAHVIVSVDSGTKETYEKVKRVPCFDKVVRNLTKYALKTTFKGRFHIRAKYIIIPGINDNREEIDAYFKMIKDAGLYIATFDIEENWFLAHRDNIPDKFKKLIDYIYKKGKKENIRIDEYERLQNYIADRNKE